MAGWFIWGGVSLVMSLGLSAVLVWAYALEMILATSMRLEGLFWAVFFAAAALWVLCLMGGLVGFQLREASAALGAAYARRRGTAPDGAQGGAIAP